jgi:pimeloyl-ACP methyl ester carboxylesterase
MQIDTRGEAPQRRGEARATAKRGAAGAEAPWREALVDGVRLAYDDEGSGPTLVCLHAIGHGARDFAPLRQRLRDRYRVVALDWPGQGNSGDDRVAASAVRYTGLLRGFLDALDLDDVVLIGNSVGGAAAIRLAAEHGERVRALVLADPGGLDLFDRMTGPFTRLFARFFAAGARGARWYPAAFAALYRMVLRGPAAAEQRRRIVASAVEVAPVLAQAWQGFGTPEADIRGLAERITCPVLFAWAKGDRINQLARSRPAIERFRGARLELFAGGHAAFLEQPDAFAAALERFLADVPGAGRVPVARSA